MRMRRVVGVWVVISGLLFWNGALALIAYKPFLSREAGEMVQACLAMALMFLGSRPFLSNEPELPVAGLARVAVIWIILTAGFEIVFGRILAAIIPWASPSDGMWDGWAWPLILLSAAAAPLAWLRRSGLTVSGLTK